MIKCLSALFFCLSLVLQSMPASALPVEGLYDAEVPVQNQSEAERDRAYREGLRQVLVRVSGRPAVLDHQRSIAAMDNAAAYVAEVSYRTGVTTSLPAPIRDDGTVPSSIPAQQTFVVLRMASEAVDGLLLDTGFGVWDRNRPAVLLWLVVQNDDGERFLLGSDSDHPALEVLSDFSRRRGVPFQIPLLDLADRRMLGTAQAWSLDEEAIRLASARYGARSVLAGRILETASGDYVGVWRFLFREQAETFDHIAGDVESFMTGPLDRVTVELARYFSLSRQDLANEEDLTVRVTNVDSLASFAALLDSMRSLSVVNDAYVSHLQGDVMELRMRVAGGAERLGEFISLDRNLERVGTGTALHYRWTR